jgi:hypothetical protein
MLRSKRGLSACPSACEINKSISAKLRLHMKLSGDLVYNAYRSNTNVT